MRNEKVFKRQMLDRNFLISYSLPVRSGGLIGYFTLKTLIIFYNFYF
jgi:hypothetical protein